MNEPEYKPHKKLRPSGGYRKTASFQTTTIVYDATYEDYLRHRRLPQWDAEGPEAMQVREVPKAFRKDRSDPSDRTDQTDLKPPQCPQCGALMALRTAKAGKNVGSQFWGCTSYPECKGTAQI